MAAPAVITAATAVRAAIITAAPAVITVAAIAVQAIIAAAQVQKAPSVFISVLNIKSNITIGSTKSVLQKQAELKKRDILLSY